MRKKKLKILKKVLAFSVKLLYDLIAVSDIETDSQYKTVVARWSSG